MTWDFLFVFCSILKNCEVSDMNIKDIYFQHYLPNKQVNRAASTIAGYESSMNLHVLPRWGECEIEDIDPDDLQEWVDNFECIGASEKAFKCLRQIIRWWIKHKRLNVSDPTVFIELRQKELYRPSVLEADEVTAMLRGFWGHKYEAVVICSLTLGLRRGEACALEWSDINFKTGAVNITKSRQYIKGEVITVRTKTKRSTRTVYLPKFALKRLKQIKGKGLITGDVSPDKVSRQIKSWCKKNNIPHVSMTNMRHTWATLAVEAGVGIETVAMMLGHTEITTAYNHYIVPRKTICAEAQAKVESLLFDRAPKLRVIKGA